MAPGPGWRVVQTMVPVGLRHAVPRIAVKAGPRFALCGADVESWVVLGRLKFTPNDPASCQRCGQLVSSARRHPSRS